MSRSPRQESLSDPVNSSELTITDVLTHAKPQTKQQATFQRLIRQIDAPVCTTARKTHRHAASA